MSAIAGRVNLDGRPVEPEAIAGMLRVQHRRGPGRAAAWVEGAVGLGHAALLLADYTVYPLHGEDEALVLVADARIDNREELAHLLEVPLTPDEDGPLLLAAYRRWGTECCRHLRGDFAFVLWDRRERRLFGARDHFGVRSLFYHHAPSKHFVFSSEIKGFWQHPEISKKLDEIRLVEAIQLTDTDASRTMFEGIRGVPAGHTFVLSDRGLRFDRYWAPEPGEEWRAPSDEAYADELRERFITATRRRMRGTDAVAAELSGGLDSSSVACVARDLRVTEGGPPLDTLSLRYPDFPQADESAYIEEVLAGGHFSPHFMNGDGRTTLTDIDRVFERIDDPSLVAANHHHVWMRFELAEQHGMKVVLTGHDGDTIVGHGFERYYELARAGAWETFRDEVTRFEQRLKDAGSGPDDQIYLSLPTVLQTYGIGSLRRAAEHSAWSDFFRMLNGLHRNFGLPRKLFLRRFARRLVTPYRALRRRQEAHAQVSALIRPELAARTDLRVRKAKVEQSDPWPMAVRERQAALLHSPFYLRTTEALDAYAAAFGLEVRHPFLDIDLVEWCLRLPSEQRLRDGWTRLVFRNAMQGILPDSIRLRPGKTSFGNTTNQLLLGVEQARLQEMLNAPGLLAEYVDIDAVRAVMRLPLEEMGRDPMRLGLFVSLRRWMHMHFS